MSIEAMKQALEVFELSLETDTKPKHAIRNTITSLRQAIEQAEKREWVGLTDEDEIDWDGGDLKSLVKAIEAKLKDKNT